MSQDLINKIDIFVKERKLPYIKKIGKIGKLKLCLVSGKYIRTNIDDNFTNFGQRYADYDFIPKDELWLDVEYKPDERKFFIENLLAQHKLGEKGKPFEDQYVAGMRKERAERRKSGDIKEVSKFKNKKTRLPKGKDVHESLWKKLEDGTKIYIVDGRLVRSIFDINFTEGGHEYVYEYIPEGEVWIDNDIVPEERGYVLLHELFERKKMSEGISYNRAHNRAVKIEHYCREHPDELHEKLQDQGFA